MWLPVGAICLAALFIWKSLAICDEAITGQLKSHVITNALSNFVGKFADVWVSSHLTKILNCSFTEIDKGGNTTNSVLYKNGQGFTSTGKIWADENGIINIKVDRLSTTGLIYPVYVTEDVLAYYNCYPHVDGKGVSVITVRVDSMRRPDTVRQVYEAKATFRYLQEVGIPVNDGADY